MGGACSSYGGGEAYTGFWWGNLRERDHLGDTGVDWGDKIRMDLQELGCRGMDWIELAQEKDRRRALVTVIMHHWVP